MAKGTRFAPTGWLGHGASGSERDRRRLLVSDEACDPSVATWQPPLQGGAGTERIPARWRGRLLVPL